MSKKLKVLVAMMVAGVIGASTTLAVQGISNTTTNSNTKLISSNSDSSNTQLVDEMVYVFAKADGTTRKIVSSDWTKNLNVDEYTTVINNDKKTPVDLKVTYKLDGKDISAKDLAGRSGKVTIRYDYKNKEVASGYYVPYAVISGLMLENDKFKNVEAVNGKIINDGARIIVAGLLLPGMQENLGLTQFEIPSYLEVTADVSDFSLNMAVSLVTNEIFNDLDFSGLNSIDQLSAELNKMTAAMDQLVGGSSDLATGLEKLYEKASALPDGVAQLSNGATQLAEGASKLDRGVDKLQEGVEGIYAGLKEKTDTNNALLQNGTKAVFQSSLDTANSNTDLRNAMSYYCHVDDPLTVENYPAVSENCLKTLAESNPTIEAVNNSLNKVYALWQGVVAYTNGIANFNETYIKNGLLANITDSENGLKTGSSAIATGTAKLSDGLGTLNDSAPALVDGINQLRDGSTKLSSGLKQFNQEAVQKLVNVYNGDIRGFIDKIQAIANVAKNHRDNAKYIYRVDEIKK